MNDQIMYKNTSQKESQKYKSEKKGRGQKKVKK